MRGLDAFKHDGHPRIEHFDAQEIVARARKRNFFGGFTHAEADIEHFLLAGRNMAAPVYEAADQAVIRLRLGSVTRLGLGERLAMAWLRIKRRRWRGIHKLNCSHFTAPEFFLSYVTTRSVFKL